MITSQSENTNYSTGAISGRALYVTLIVNDIRSILIGKVVKYNGGARAGLRSCRKMGLQIVVIFGFVEKDS